MDRVPQNQNGSAELTRNASSSPYLASDGQDQVSPWLMPLTIDEVVGTKSRWNLTKIRERKRIFDFSNRHTQFIQFIQE